MRNANIKENIILSTVALPYDTPFTIETTVPTSTIMYIVMCTNEINDANILSYHLISGRSLHNLPICIHRSYY